MTTDFNQNRLATATSPYLLQHKDNPVHWQPWEAAVFDEARRRDVPILLSVGYAACHWCHVMAHESFEDDEVAAVMNAHYVCVKLDREERPDIDEIYMTALSMLGEQTGWPLTIFMTPDGKPFWGGTYFPKMPQYGRPGFIQVLQELSRVWHDDRSRIANNARALTEALTARARADAKGSLHSDLPPRAARSIAAHMDRQRGGMNGAPKFPQPFFYRFLRHQAQRDHDASLQEAVRLTARQICLGGMNDHVGGGFARYSVDADWLVPHFEKMLYDNALLIGLLVDMVKDAHAESGANSADAALFSHHLTATIDWLTRDMRLENGSFAASLDADTEGEEGLFYVWQKPEVEALLGAEAADFCDAYDITEAGNFEGRNIPNRLKTPEIQPDENALKANLAVLRAARDKRTRPGRDDKCLADWNAMMIVALSEAALCFRNPEWLALAERAFAACLDSLATKDGRLMHSARNGNCLDISLADDYAHMALAACALFQTTGDSAYLDYAKNWVARLNADYLDPERGGYCACAAGQADVLVRNRPSTDNATISANAATLEALARLWHLTGESDYHTAATALREALGGLLPSNYVSMTGFLNAALLHDYGVLLVLVAPDTAAPPLSDTAMAPLLDIAGTHRLAGLVTLVTPDTAALSPTHPAFGKTAIDGKPTAYICANQSCRPPITDPSDLRAALDALISGGHN